ncbi:MarR family winged helix-turn-helix transcriptional regulator [Nocardia sp. alder85J]|uniref:MarR family winged helix-turn-helix transcriptional regulator n=1 Tax=Nocardia sp. alder85J TaxID=2862949 RepID=UPI001CD78B6D|nr:MarR family winged helix-turn-helix transcriptional regulator [Nocardia sp. alder85J]MCX4091911.1 MarR family winged helix-turn-helix transcriptional regulator [Nocardia sp. alder85J]
MDEEAEVSPSMRLATALSRLQQHRRFQEQEQRPILGSAEIRLLWLLRDGTARTQRQIITELGLDQSTVNRQVNAALATGILRRHRPEGATAHLVEVTEHGFRTLEQGIGDMLRSYDLALADFDDTDRGRLLDLFDRFVDTYSRIVRADTATVPPTTAGGV